MSVDLASLRRGMLLQHKHGVRRYEVVELDLEDQRARLRDLDSGSERTVSESELAWEFDPVSR